MSVVELIFTEYVDDVHDELKQLSVETLSLAQRCIARGKLGDVNRFK